MYLLNERDALLFAQMCYKSCNTSASYWYYNENNMLPTLGIEASIDHTFSFITSNLKVQIAIDKLFAQDVSFD